MDGIRIVFTIRFTNAIQIICSTVTILDRKSLSILLKSWQFWQLAAICHEYVHTYHRKKTSSMFYYSVSLAQWLIRRIRKNNFSLTCVQVIQQQGSTWLASKPQNSSSSSNKGPQTSVGQWSLPVLEERKYDFEV